MNGPTHRLTGAATWLVVSPLLTATPAGVLAGGVVAVVCSGGRGWSPDADQGWLWRALDRWLPDEWMGEGGPLQHRGITHWWFWPVALLLVAWWLPVSLTLTAGGWAGTMPMGLPLSAVAVGWGSHILGDFLIGAEGGGREAGVPLGPWFWHVGLGFECDGLMERFIRWALVPAVGVLVAWQVGVPMPDMETITEAMR